MLVYSYTKIAIKRVFGRTGQLIPVEVEVLQLSKLPNLRRDGACQRISSHKTLSGRLVYQSINLSKTVLPVNNWFSLRLRSVSCTRCPIWVGIAPANVFSVTRQLIALVG